MPALPYIAIGRLEDRTVLASECQLEEAQKTQIEDVFRRLLEASRQKLSAGQRQRLQWNAGSVCCLVDGEGKNLLCLVTESVDYPEQQAFRCLNDLWQEVAKHDGTFQSCASMGLQQQLSATMTALLRTYADPSQQQGAERPAPRVGPADSYDARPAAGSLANPSERVRRQLFLRNVKIAGGAACAVVVLLAYLFWPSSDEPVPPAPAGAVVV